MRCLLCKSDNMIEARHTYIAQLEKCYVIIENVPCYECTQCGEVVYSASVMEKIDEMLEQFETVANKIFIVDYANAA